MAQITNNWPNLLISQARSILARVQAPAKGAEATKKLEEKTSNKSKRSQAEKLLTKSGPGIQEMPVDFSDLSLQEKEKPVNRTPMSKLSKFLASLRKSSAFNLVMLSFSGAGFYSLFQVFTGAVKGTAAKLASAAGGLGLLAVGLLSEKVILPFLDKLSDPPDPDSVDLNKDICWDEKAKAEFYRALRQFFGYASSFQEKGDFRVVGTRRGGMLILSGPPGTGKTAIAKGIATQAKKKLIPIKVSNIESMYFGEAEKKMTEYFERAAREKAILFFDEADALLRARAGGSGSSAVHANKLTNTFLQAFNEHQDEGAMVILATNTPDAIDPAIKSRAYLSHIPAPSLELREKIFLKKLQTHHIKPQYYKPILEKERVRIRSLLEKYNFTGRDIEAGILDALSVAERRVSNLKYHNKLVPELDRLLIEDFDKAFETIDRNNRAASVSSLDVNGEGNFLEVLAKLAGKKK